MSQSSLVKCIFTACLGDPVKGIQSEGNPPQQGKTVVKPDRGSKPSSFYANTQKVCPGVIYCTVK